MLGVCALANWMVNPYSVFAPPRIAGINQIKPDYLEHLRLSGPYAVRRLAPEAIIIGTSRAGRGFSPIHPRWNDLLCYNLSLPAIGAYEIFRYLQHAHAIKPLKKAVIGLDFRVFFAALDPATFREERLAVDAEGKPQFKPLQALLPDYAASLLSTDATLASLRAIRMQYWAKTSLSPQGLWQNMDDSFDSAGAFEAYTLNSFERYAEFAREPFDEHARIEPIVAIMRLAHHEKIEVSFVIPPSHAWHWETLRMAGLLDEFIALKRALVHANDEEARRAGRAAFPLWDFSGYIEPAREPVPAHGAKTEWFWEPVHFKLALGDKVLAEVLNEGSSRAELGVKLTTENIERHLAHWEAQAQRYRADHSRDLARIAAIQAKVAHADARHP